MKKTFLFILTLSAIAIARTWCWDPTGVGTIADSAKTWSVGCRLDTIMVLYDSVKAGDVIACRSPDGTIIDTLHANRDLTARDGTVTNPITWTSVKSTCTDTGANLDSSDYEWDTTKVVLVDQLGFTIALGDYQKYMLLQNKSSCAAAGAGTSPIVFIAGSIVSKCIFTNDTTSVAATKYAVSVNNGWIENCRVYTNYANGINLAGAAQAFGCKVFGDAQRSRYGIYYANAGGISTLCDVINFGFGFRVDNDRTTIINCNASACSTSVYVGNNNTVRVINVAVDGSKKYGVYAATQNNSNHYDYLHGDDARNVDMYYNVSAPVHTTSGDPGWTDPANGDFSLSNPATSPLTNTGIGNE